MTENQSKGFWPWPYKPVDPPTPDEEPARPGMANYVKIWALFRQIPIEKLGSMAVLIPLIVFFAVSGFLAWAAILSGFFLRILWTAFRGFRRGA